MAPNVHIQCRRALFVRYLTLNVIAYFLSIPIYPYFLQQTLPWVFLFKIRSVENVLLSRGIDGNRIFKQAYLAAYTTKSGSSRNTNARTGASLNAIVTNVRNVRKSFPHAGKSSAVHPTVSRADKKTNATAREIRNIRTKRMNQTQRRTRGIPNVTL